MMTLQDLIDFANGEDSTGRLLRFRLSAYKLARIVTIKRSILVMTVLSMPFTMLVYMDKEARILSVETASSVVIFISFVFTILLSTVEVFGKGFASQITLADANALEALASEGHEEAALCLADLHAKRGADAHELMWLQRAAKMGHKTAIKRLAK